jgi:hypothetical protein
MKAASRILLLRPTTTSVVLRVRPPLVARSLRKREARNNTKCSRTKLETVFGLDHSSHSLIRTCFGFRYSDFGFSSFGFSQPAFRILLSFLLILSWQLSAYSAQAGGRRPANNKKSRTSPWGRYKKLARVRSIDGVDYVEFESTAPRGQKKQPSPGGNNSSDSATDLDESDNALEDLSVNTPRRNDHNLAHVSVCDLGALNIRAPGTTQSFLAPARSFYCLHEHIRERAPPSLV